MTGDRLNRGFDRAVGLHMRIGSRSIHSWRFFSLAAFAVACAVWLGLGAARDVPILALALPPLVSFAIFSAQHRRTVRARRPARFVFHRHLAASAIAVVALLALVDALSWTAIDTATVAVLAGLAVGRIGCLRVGCCSGRPAAVGPRYPWLEPAGRRFPVQLLDAGICVALIAVCLALDAPGGVATAVGLGGYFAARSLIDELRAERRAAQRLTEAQRLTLTAAFAGALTFGLLTLR